MMTMMMIIMDMEIMTMMNTKHLALFLILSLTSCQPKTFELTDGTMITQRKADRIIKKCLRKAWRQMPKEGKKILTETPVYIKVDTTGN